MKAKYGLLKIEGIYIISKAYVLGFDGKSYDVIFPYKDINSITNINTKSEKVSELYDSYDDAKKRKDEKNSSILYTINQLPYGLDLTEKVSHIREKTKNRYRKCMEFENDILFLEENMIVDISKKKVKK